MTPSLTGPQIVALRELAGLDAPARRRPWPQTLTALSAKGLRNPDGTVTGLGKVAARMRGWTPSERQQELIVCLAQGDVWLSNRYELPYRAHATALNGFVDAGIAVLGLRRGHRFVRATSLCLQLDIDLRQQTLPPPPGRA